MTCTCFSELVIVELSFVSYDTAVQLTSWSHGNSSQPDHSVFVSEGSNPPTHTQVFTMSDEEGMYGCYLTCFESVLCLSYIRFLEFN